MVNRTNSKFGDREFEPRRDHFIKTKTMIHLFVPFEIAVKLKEKGFNEFCFGYYSADKRFIKFPSQLLENQTRNSYFEELEEKFFTAPTYQQVIDWLFERLHTNENWDEIIYSGSKTYSELDLEIEESLSQL